MSSKERITYFIIVIFFLLLCIGYISYNYSHGYPLGIWVFFTIISLICIPPLLIKK